MKSVENYRADLKASANVCILGPSGYTGHELIRILLNHTKVKIKLLIGDKSSGKDISDIFSAFSNLDLPRIKSFEHAEFKGIDIIFSCMPSGKLASIIHLLPKDATIIDLSADFRIKDIKLYEKYYGKHQNIKFINKFTYGLTEIYGKEIKKSKYISCPGCYPTSVLLPILPLIKNNIILMKDVIVDSKSGISGAGRSFKKDLLFSENNNSFTAYGKGDHRHIPEMEHHILNITSKKINIIFTPHLIPINRGIFTTIYLKGNIDTISSTLNKNYRKDKFIIINKLGNIPKLSDVLGSNNCKIGILKHKRKDYIILTSVIDNLLKGASGQAVQNMNLIFNFPLELGLDQLPLWP